MMPAVLSCQTAKRQRSTSYLINNFDALHVRGAFNAESRWTAERLSSTDACLTLYLPDAQDTVLDELIYHGETGLVSDTRFRCFQACTDENAPENVRTYTYNALLSSVYQKLPFECFADYLDGQFSMLSQLGLWNYETVWSVSMTEQTIRLTISGLPNGGSEAFTLDLDTMLVRREGKQTRSARSLRSGSTLPFNGGWTNCRFSSLTRLLRITACRTAPRRISHGYTQ